MPGRKKDCCGGAAAGAAGGPLEGGGGGGAAPPLVGVDVDGGFPKGVLVADGAGGGGGIGVDVSTVVDVAPGGGADPPYNETRPAMSSLCGPLIADPELYEPHIAAPGQLADCV